MYSDLLCLRPHKMGALCSDDHCLSVRLSVRCLTLSRERKGHSKLKIGGGKPMTRMTCDLIQRSKVKGQGHQAAQRRNTKSVISSEREGHMNFQLGTRMEYDTVTCIADMRCELKDQRSRL